MCPSCRSEHIRAVMIHGEPSPIARYYGLCLDCGARWEPGRAQRPRCPVCRGTLALEEEVDGRRRLHCLLCPWAREYPSDQELRCREELRALTPEQRRARGRPRGSFGRGSLAQRVRDAAATEPRLSDVEIARRMGCRSSMVSQVLRPLRESCATS